jgi:hypothetical protein
MLLFSPLSFPKSLLRMLHQVADHLIPNQVLGFFEFFREERGRRLLFSKAWKNLYRHRFKEIEDAPFAAYYLVHYSKSNHRL